MRSWWELRITDSPMTSSSSSWDLPWVTVHCARQGHIRPAFAWVTATISKNTPAGSTGCSSPSLVPWAARARASGLKRSHSRRSPRSASTSMLPAARTRPGLPSSIASMRAPSPCGTGTTDHSLDISNDRGTARPLCTTNPLREKLEPGRLRSSRESGWGHLEMTAAASGFRLNRRNGSTN